MKQALKPIRRRMRWLHSVRGLLIGLLVAAAACLALVIVSFFVPIEALWKILTPIAAGCPVAGLLVGLLWPISRQAAARQADACGLKERTITALALDGDKTPMAQLQRADTEASLAALPVRRAMPVRVQRRQWLPTGILVVLACALLLLPNPQHDVLRARARERLVLQAQADEIEKTAEKLAQDDMTEDEIRELRRITGKMAQELREATDKRDALEKLDEGQREMERLQRQVEQRTAGDMAQALASQPGLKSLAQAMEAGDQAALQEALDALSEEMETPEGLESLGEQLAEAAQSVPAGLAQQSLSASANAAVMGDATSAMQSLANACSATGAGASAAGANLSALMRMARSGVSQAQQAGSTPGSGGSGGSGSGAGGGGGGAGRGTTQADGGYSEGFSQSANSLPGGQGFTDRVGAYEQIYDPTRLGGDNEATLAQGQTNNEDIQQIQMGPGVGDVSGMVPYNQVVGEYQQAAAQAMRRDALPATLQDFVNRYFNALID